MAPQPMTPMQPIQSQPIQNQYTPTMAPIIGGKNTVTSIQISELHIIMFILVIIIIINCVTLGIILNIMTSNNNINNAK